MHSAAGTPGWKVVQDSTGPATGRIRSMVESGRITWDLCDSSASGANLFGKLGLATKIDYGIVHREHAIGPGFALDCGGARSRSSATSWRRSTTAGFPAP